MNFWKALPILNPSNSAGVLILKSDPLLFDCARQVAAHAWNLHGFRVCLCNPRYELQLCNFEIVFASLYDTIMPVQKVGSGWFDQSSHQPIQGITLYLFTPFRLWLAIVDSWHRSCRRLGQANIRNVLTGNVNVTKFVAPPHSQEAQGRKTRAFFIFRR